MTKTNLPRLLTTKEVAAALGLPLHTLYSMIRSGEGPPFMKIGTSYRFAEPAVAAWIVAQHANNFNCDWDTHDPIEMHRLLTERSRS